MEPLYENIIESENESISSLGSLNYQYAENEYLNLTEEIEEEFDKLELCFLIYIKCTYVIVLYFI